MKTLLGAITLLLLLSLSPASASNLMRIRVAHERVRGRPQQIITVYFWPEPPDRVLHLTATSPDSFRASSVRLYGTESQRQHSFVWHLPRSMTVHQEGVEPYEVVATTMDAEGHVTGQASTKFYVQ